MADKSRLWNPPQDDVPWEDPAIVRVPQKEMDWGNRKSQQKAWDQKAVDGLKNLPNGR